MRFVQLKFQKRSPEFENKHCQVTQKCAALQREKKNPRPDAVMLTGQSESCREKPGKMQEGRENFRSTR